MSNFSLFRKIEQEENILKVLQKFVENDLFLLDTDSHIKVISFEENPAEFEVREDYIVIIYEFINDDNILDIDREYIKLSDFYEFYIKFNVGKLNVSKPVKIDLKEFIKTQKIKLIQEIKDIVSKNGVINCEDDKLYGLDPGYEWQNTIYITKMYISNDKVCWYDIEDRDGNINDFTLESLVYLLDELKLKEF